MGDFGVALMPGATPVWVDPIPSAGATAPARSPPNGPEPGRTARIDAAAEPVVAAELAGATRTPTPDAATGPVSEPAGPTTRVVPAPEDATEGATGSPVPPTNVVPLLVVVAPETMTWIAVNRVVASVANACAPAVTAAEVPVTFVAPSPTAVTAGVAASEVPVTFSVAAPVELPPPVVEIAVPAA